MRCPCCGNEVTSMYGKAMTQAEYYARIAAQQQNMNQLSGPGWQNYHGQGAGLADAIDHSKDDEPKPEPKPTAWQQLKILLKAMIP